MRNEILLLGSVVLIYGVVLLAYKLFGKNGMYAMTVICTILANIEVLLMIDAFGMEQTLGNVMFAATYLITDILSENEGKKSAALAVWLGVFASVVMLMFSQYWLLYTPAASDWAGEHIRTIFSTTPRMLLASLLGYVISQRFDVWLYHRWWKLTSERTGDSHRFLWLRNNGSTLISQVINTVLFTLVAFAGWYDTKTLISIMVSSYIIFICTSLLDTPVVYIARSMKEKSKCAVIENYFDNKASGEN
ncbi:MAG: queuosine precursor transporter [Eubacteriales bacterium]